VEREREQAAAYMFLYMFGGKDVLKDSKVDMRKYQEIVAKVKAVEKKCEDGDLAACECLQSLSDKGTKKSFTPTGDLFEDTNPKAKSSRAKPDRGGR